MDNASRREALESARLEYGRSVDEGMSVAEAARRFSDAIDRRVVERIRCSLQDTCGIDFENAAAAIAVFAVGGYGRRELAPYSDIDLLIVSDRRISEAEVKWIKALVRDLWDDGMSLSQSVCTRAELRRRFQTEVETATSALDARLLFDGGSGPESLQAVVAAASKSKRFTERLRAGLSAEQEKFGARVNLLEPDVKRSAGGLRNLQLARWIGAVRHGCGSIEELGKAGILREDRVECLLAARELLMRLRVELHLHARKTSDMLLRCEQLRIAKKWGYADAAGILGVERFMRMYFQHVSQAREIVERFADQQNQTPWRRTANRLVSGLQLESGIRLMARRLEVNDAWLNLAEQSDEALAHLAKLAAWHGVDLDERLLDRLDRGDNSGGGAATEPSKTLGRVLLQILEQPGWIARTLRTLHRRRGLARILPEFERIRCLLQFNAYHKYTVDEHTLTMLEYAEGLIHEKGLLGESYRRIGRKDLLHLAILLHDVGKGLPGDHSEEGEKIALEVADRLMLDDEERATVATLVKMHLELSRLAFQRDASDHRLCMRLARDIGSEELLRKLFVLTCVDLMAVGPGNFTSWRAELLASVYLRCRSMFGVNADGSDDDRLERKRLAERLGGGEIAEGFAGALSLKCLRSTDFSKLRNAFQTWTATNGWPAVISACHHPETGTSTYLVLTHEGCTEGAFHKICGALAAHRLEVLSARIRSFDDGLVMDQFEVQDVHHGGEPTVERIEKIGGTIRRVLSGELTVSDVLWSGRSSSFGPKRSFLTAGNSQIAVDNESSDDCTVIDVFTANRRGLLYTVARGIFRLGLSVRFATIATYEESVIDTFYVVEADGLKATRPDRIRMIRDHLSSDLDKLASDPRSMGF